MQRCGLKFLLSFRPPFQREEYQSLQLENWEKKNIKLLYLYYYYVGSL